MSLQDILLIMKKKIEYLEFQFCREKNKTSNYFSISYGMFYSRLVSRMLKSYALDGVTRPIAKIIDTSKGS